MGPYDEEMEGYLKEFRPRAIREFEVAPQPRNILWRWFAAAAALAMCAGWLFYFAYREPPMSKDAENIQPPNVGVVSQQPNWAGLALTTLALTDNERFESLLAVESRKSLPTFRGEQSGLKVLAKD